MDNLIEEWRTIEDFPEYAVSNLGRIKRIKKGYCNTKVGRVLIAKTYKTGYQMLTLCKDKKKYTKTIHCLVAEAFIEKRPFGMQVNHKDGVKTNNHIRNLEYVTVSENNLHAVRTGLHPIFYGEKTHTSKLSNKDVLRIVELRKSGLSLGKIAGMFPVKEAALGHIFKGRRWSEVTGITPETAHLITISRNKLIMIDIPGLCELCGNSFVGHRKDRKFCNDPECKKLQKKMSRHVVAERLHGHVYINKLK
jgi:hypothetical protein